MGIGVTYTVFPPPKDGYWWGNVKYYGLWPITWFLVLTLVFIKEDNIWEGLKSTIKKINNDEDLM